MWFFVLLSVANRSSDPPVDGIDYGTPAASWLQQFLSKQDLSLVLIRPDITLRQSSRDSEEGGVEQMQVHVLE